MRGQRRRQSTGGDQAGLEAWSRSFTPSRHAAAREELARLEAALRALDEDKREVILLSRIVGLTHAGIAAEMGRSELATRKLLSRALAELAERMVRPHKV
jgi:RNA polymerase sigma-70 factor (ECF subfamily)